MLSPKSVPAFKAGVRVNTEIAQVRGQYGFPKWVTDIDVDIDAHRTRAGVSDGNGNTDLAPSFATPAQTKYPTGQ